ncbi:MAG: hypothetical protein K6G23_11065 [Lachnospiraceae bacterium]|nr:hypothetical protein [Lachnospiraceae bacterium]
MAIYLIDYENVHEKGLTGIETLHPNDVLCLLYSNAAQSLTIDTMAYLTGSGAEVQYFKCLGSGKNYLDFQLSTVLGLMAGSRKDNEFVIISGDKGFQSLVDFWDGQIYLERKFRCRLQATIAGGEVKGKAAAKKTTAAKTKAAGAKETASAKAAGGKKAANAKTTGGKATKNDKTAVKNGKSAKGATAKKSDNSAGTAEKTIELIPMQEKQKAVAEMPERKQAAGSAAAEVSTDASKKSKSTLQNLGILSIAESVRKKVRSTVKELELLPKDYTAIYNNFLKASSEAELKNRMMQSIGREKGAQTYEKTLEIYRDLTGKSK